MFGKLFAVAFCGLALLPTIVVGFRVHRKVHKHRGQRAALSQSIELESRGADLLTSESALFAALEKDLGRTPTKEELGAASVSSKLMEAEIHFTPEQTRESPCLEEAKGHKNYPCIDNWRAHDKCINSHTEFTYSASQRFSGCGDHTANGTAAWCSEYETYSTRRFQYCTPCKESPDGSDGGITAVWTAVSKPLRCVDVAMTAGTENGRLYTFENGARSLSDVFPAASGSKWIVAVAIASVVRDGVLSFDSLIKDTVPWWAQSADDPRSRITLRHLLQFTSGFRVTGPLSMSHHPYHHTCLNWEGYRGGDWTLEECAHQLYEKVEYSGEPGIGWQYNSVHLQLAFYMATLATRETPSEFLLKRVYHNQAGQRVMENTYFVGKENPAVALGMMTTGSDYDAFMRNYMAYKYLPKSICDEMETENLKANNIPKVAPAISFAHTFGMVIFEFESLRGMCMGLGGTMSVCLNRQAGIYYLILPPLTDYLKKGKFMIRQFGGEQAITFYSARYWIEAKLFAAFEAEEVGTLDGLKRNY